MAGQRMCTASWRHLRDDLLVVVACDSSAAAMETTLLVFPHTPSPEACFSLRRGTRMESRTRASRTHQPFDRRRPEGWPQDRRHVERRLPSSEAEA